MTQKQLLRLFAVATLSLAACFYNPTDGSEVGAVRPDGRPSAINLVGYGVAPSVPVAVEMFDPALGTWSEVANVQTSASELGSTGLFPWEIRHFRAADDRFFAAAPLPDSGRPGRFARFRAFYGAQRNHMLTFDAQGKACVEHELGKGLDAKSAGAQCATGNELTLWWDAETGAPGKRVQLEVTEYPCAAPQILTSNPEEAGHLAATRFDPPVYPFAVDAVSYFLLHDPAPGLSYGCDATMAHEVRFYRSSTRLPSADPELVATQVVTGEAPTAGSVEVLTRVELAVPVVLEEGEYLFVAVQFPRPDFQGVCIEACAVGKDYEPNRHFWSYAAAPPYDWREFSTFGGDWDTLMWLEGYPVEP